VPLCGFPAGSVRVRVQFRVSLVFYGDSAVPSPLTILLIAIAGVFCHNGLNYVLSLTGRRKDPLKPSSAFYACSAAATPWPAWRGIAQPTCLRAYTQRSGRVFSPARS